MDVLLNGNHLKQEHKDIYQANFRKYRPIELDLSISHDVKLQKMVEWWSSSLGIFSSYGFTLNDFDQMVKESKMAMRYGILEIFKSAGE